MKIKYKTKPWPHQVRVLKRMVRQRGGGINVPMRWGKSWVGIHWCVALHELEGVERVLIETVTSGLGVWEDEIAKHCPVPYRVLNLKGEEVLRSEDWEDGHLQFLIVNFPNIFWRAFPDPTSRAWVVVDNKLIHKFKPQAHIVDESHHIGNPTAECSKHTYRIAKHAPYRLFMTGTMFHRKPFFVFGQMKFYDGGQRFGGSWTNFKKRIALFGGYMNYEVKGYRDMQWMMSLVREVAHIEKYVPPGPRVENVLHFDLEGKHLEAYQSMDIDRVLKVGDEVVTAEMVLTLHLRRLQLAGGFIKTSKGYVQVGDCKLRMAEDRLREYREQEIHKAVIGCRFLPELPALAKVAKKLGFTPVVFHGGLSSQKARARIHYFQHTQKPCLFITQIDAAKESIDLSAASVTMWYSLTESYVAFDQFKRRIEKFKDKRRLMDDFLVARGTHDEVALQAMRLKMDVADFLITAPKKVEQLKLG